MTDVASKAGEEAIGKLVNRGYPAQEREPTTSVKARCEEIEQLIAILGQKIKSLRKVLEG